MKRKIFLITTCLVLVCAITVLSTMAYLTASAGAVNTFTVGHVNILLDEACVDQNGELVLDDVGNPVDRVTGNEYHLVPGRTYIKDPTITIRSASEESYVRMLVTIDKLTELDKIFEENGGAVLTDIFLGHDNEIWVYAGETEDASANTITYEFRYHEPVEGFDDVGAAADIKLPPLFTEVQVPGVITGEQLATIADMTITVMGHAIQSTGFAGVDAAWAAFDVQTAEALPGA